MIPNNMAEFRDNGVTHLVWCNCWCERMLKEIGFFNVIKLNAHRMGITLFEMHAPFGSPFDLSCMEKARIPQLIEEHSQFLEYAAELGCKTYTMHIGSYEAVEMGTPLEVIREQVIDKLEKLLPVAEKADVIIAIENGMSPADTPEEVVSYVRHFNSKHIGNCFDAGHANVMNRRDKNQELFSDSLRSAWGGTVRQYDDCLGIMAPTIVTCHLHDNNSYSDQHNKIGEGTIDWPTLMHRLATECPRLQSLQNETSSTGRYSIKENIAAALNVMQYFK
jgi:sugar phosphate isomerase/epimerase